jgi:tRNA pseudouridine55 synthase
MSESGFILINKPSGPTSHDIIDRLRRITGVRKIGHAGTLDPFASGVLVCAIGREATREISIFVKLDKKYRAVLKLGETRDTYDRMGRIFDFRFSIFDLTPNKNQILDSLKGFIGKQLQTPPMFSAKKLGGKKLYELARKGIEVEREPAEVEIFDIKLIGYEWPRLEIETHVSSGTYIRSLAHDIGIKLGCGAYLEELVRTAVGSFEIGQTIDMQAVTKEKWKGFLFSAL